MADTGLLGGIGQGLQNFLGTYMQVRNQQEASRQKNLSNALELHKQNLLIDPATADSQNPGLISAGGEDKSAALMRKIAIDQYKTLHPDYTDEQINSTIPEGLSPDQYSKAAGLLKPQIGGYYGLEKSKMATDAAKERTDVFRQNAGIRRESLDLQRGKAAAGIADKVMLDPVVKATDMQQNSITKGLQQLNSKDKPITNQMLNEIQADYANALTGGRQAAQGTIHDQQMQTLAAKAANLKQYISGSPTQAATPEQIKYFRTAFKELQDLNSSIRQQRVQSLTANKTAAFGNQGAFGNVINQLNSDSSGQGLILKSTSNKGVPDMSREDKIKALKEAGVLK